MAEKKPTLRERPAFAMLRRSEEESSEDPETQTTEPSNVQVTEPSEDPPSEASNGRSSEHPNVQTSEPPISAKALFRKRKGRYLQPVTIYLEPEDVRALNRYQFEHTDRTGESIDKSEVVRQALRAWLTSHHSSS